MLPNRTRLVSFPQDSEPLTETDYQVGDYIWINPRANLYRAALLCFAGEASTKKGPKLLKQLQKEKAVLVTPPRSFEGIIRERVRCQAQANSLHSCFTTSR